MHRLSIADTPRDTTRPHPQRRGWGLVLLGIVGSAGQLGLDAVDQPPQRDVDPAGHPLPLEGPDVVRGLGDEVMRQLEGVR